MTLTASEFVKSWSFSRYATYKECPAKFKYKNIDRLPDPGSPAMRRGNVIHKMAEDYVLAKKKPKKLPNELTEVKKYLKHLRKNDAIVEQAWGFTDRWKWIGRKGWFGDDVWLRAKADAAVIYPDNTALLGDWKTGRRYATNEEQVELFSMTAFMRFPEITEVDTRLWYTDQPKGDNEVQRTFYAKDFKKLKKKWEKKIKPMFADTSFLPTPNEKCKWCPFSKAKGGPCKF